MFTTPPPPVCSSLFFFHDPATTEIYPLSLHDALPIYEVSAHPDHDGLGRDSGRLLRLPQCGGGGRSLGRRSEEHTSELQSQSNLVCRLLLEKKKKKKKQKNDKKNRAR